VSLRVDESSGATLTMDVARWAARADVVDQLVVARCEAPVLDLGCGPGRMVRALVEAGVSALGIDMSAEAVELSQRFGGPALRARLEDRLPAEGRWGTVLLVDGNVGIGGDVLTLLRRCRALVAPGGLIVCEVDADQSGQTSAWVVLRSRDAHSAPLRWSRVGAAGLKGLAAGLDLLVVEEWSAGRRAFVALRAA
jgi:SAM-dependent methyltransferase